MKRLVAAMSKRIRQQNIELKDGQSLLRKWKRKEQKSQEQINVLTKAMESTTGMSRKIKRQTGELKDSRTQLRKGKRKQQKSQEQINVLTKAMESTTGMSRKIKRQTGELKDSRTQLRKGKRKQQKSQEQINILTKAMESTSDGIFIIDAQIRDFPLVYTNHSFHKMTGYSKAETKNKSYLKLYHKAADRGVVSEIKDAIKLNRPFHGEIYSLARNGRKYWSLLRITPVRGPDGSVTHFFGLQADVTQKRARELKFEEQRDELLHVTRVGKLAEFVSSLAHEISQPLTSILSYAQAAKRMLAGVNPEISGILSYIINDDRRAAAVIQRLRALLKKGTPEMKPIEIGSLIKNTVALMTTDATVRNISIKVRLEQGLPPVRGDKIQLQQVILNLISNSFDAIGNDQTVRKISVSSSQNGKGNIVTAVKDSGSGILAKDLPKLFTHFFTSKPDGLGMGLSISRSIIEAHGGSLSAKNNPDNGATFFFTLPAGKRGAR